MMYFFGQWCISSASIGNQLPKTKEKFCSSHIQHKDREHCEMDFKSHWFVLILLAPNRRSSSRKALESNGIFSEINPQEWLVFSNDISAMFCLLFCDKKVFTFSVMHQLIYLFYVKNIQPDFGFSENATPHFPFHSKSGLSSSKQKDLKFKKSECTPQLLHSTPFFEIASCSNTSFFSEPIMWSHHPLYQRIVNLILFCFVGWYVHCSNPKENGKRKSVGWHTVFYSRVW